MRLLAVVLALLLTGCAAPGKEESFQCVQTEERPPALAAAPVCFPAAELEPPIVTEEEILRSYDLAVEAWSWFELQPLAHEAAGVELDGEIYWQVRSPAFKTLDDLRDHLRRVFSESLTEELLDQESRRPLYREHNGALYVRTGGRQRDGTKGARQIAVEQETDSRYSVNITVDVLRAGTGEVTGLEFWTFPFALEDGRWVFTDFRLID